jgi:NAD(P)-dependent dehydrogenase (short-subunit alcohol dehydrogenase family)
MLKSPRQRHAAKANCCSVPRGAGGTMDKQKVAVVTGASSGLGLEVAINLAERGWHVIAHGRDADRSWAAEQKIKQAAASRARIDMLRCDLCMMSEAANFADRVGAITGKVDVLINNAGGTRSALEFTSEGNELTFAGNHLGHFLLTTRLAPLLRQAATQAGGARIINVSSRAHERASIDWDDLQHKKSGTAHDAYGRAKLCNILFTRELAKRWGKLGIVASVMHPGVADTNFVAHGTQALKDYWKLAEKVSAADGADTIIWLATESEPAWMNGHYFYDRQAIPASAIASDDATSERLWVESEALLSRLGL